jgi:hypothetical protein
MATTTAFRTANHTPSDPRIHDGVIVNTLPACRPALLRLRKGLADERELKEALLAACVVVVENGSTRSVGEDCIYKERDFFLEKRYFYRGLFAGRCGRGLEPPPARARPCRLHHRERELVYTVGKVLGLTSGEVADSGACCMP